MEETQKKMKADISKECGSSDIKEEKGGMNKSTTKIEDEGVSLGEGVE